MGSKASKKPAKIPAKGVIAKVDKTARVAPPKQPGNYKGGKVPQRKTNKSMSAKQKLAKGMKMLADGDD